MTAPSQTAPRLAKDKTCPNCHQTKPPPHYAGGLCQACHVYQRSHGVPRPASLFTKPKNPASCTNCRANPATRKGLCNRCTQYLRDTGTMRPAVAEDLHEVELQRRRVIAEAKASLLCPVCGREAGIAGRPIRGLCASCARQRQRARARALQSSPAR